MAADLHFLNSGEIEVTLQVFLLDKTKKKKNSKSKSLNCFPL